ncbi:hypothetical protein IMG5_189960, partial [Ichthyophthirius multifiliis]
ILLKIEYLKIKQLTRKYNLRNKKNKSKNSLKPYLLQITLGLNAILEGLAIGLEKDGQNVQYYLELLLLLQMVLQGIYVQVNYVKKAQIISNLKVTTIMVIILAIMNIIGIGIGWILSGSENYI